MDLIITIGNFYTCAYTQLPVCLVHLAKTDAVVYNSPAINPTFLKIIMLIQLSEVAELYYLKLRGAAVIYSSLPSLIMN